MKPGSRNTCPPTGGLADFVAHVPVVGMHFRRGGSRTALTNPGHRYFIECGAARLINSRGVMILVFFQNLGKCF